MNPITFVAYNDWVGLYLDGQLVFQGADTSDIPFPSLLKRLNIPFDAYYDEQEMSHELLPRNLADLNLTLDGPDAE